MGDFNSNSPTIRGTEVRFKHGRLHTIDSAQRGIMMRHKPMTAPNIDVFLARVVGAPGLAIEILNDNVIQTPTVTLYKPQTNTGAVTTGWLNFALGATDFSYISDGNDATGHVNSGVIPTSGNINNALHHLYRLNQGSFAGRRILKIRVHALCRCDFDITIPPYGAYIVGCFDLGGVRHYTAPQLLGEGVTPTALHFDAIARPGTWVPWEAADITAMSTGTDEFGVAVLSVYGTSIPAGRFRIYEMGLEVTYLGTDNRVRYYYTPALSPPIASGEQWIERAATAVAAAGNYHYLHLFNWFNGSVQDSFTIPIARDPDAVKATGFAAATGEHRQCFDTTLGPGGVVTAAAETVAAGVEMLPVLFENGGVIGSQSMPYTFVWGGFIDGGSGANEAQEVTTAAGTTYGGIIIALGWATDTPPEAPLTIELRTGGGYSGGSLVSTMTVQPTQVPQRGLQDVFVGFPLGPIALSATTQYFLRFSSTAPSFRGWFVGNVAASNIISTGVTAAEINSATQGGTTDTAIIDGAGADNWDFQVAFVQAPTAPTNVLATVVPEICDELPGYVRVEWDAGATLGANFGGWKIKRRPRRGVHNIDGDWRTIGFINGLRTGYSPATIEANEQTFNDWTAAYAQDGGQYADGWEYGVSVVHALTGIESTLSTAPFAATPTPSPSTRWWANSNRRPFLNSLFASAVGVGGGFQQRQEVYNFAGRDQAAVSGPAERAPREWELSIDNFDEVGEDSYRRLFAAAYLLEPMSLVGPMGQLVTGVLELPSSSQYQHQLGRHPVSIPFTETHRVLDPVEDVPDGNLMCGLVLNGSSQYVQHGDAFNFLDPLTSDFTVFVFAVFANSAGTRDALGKVNNAGGQGYRIGSTGSANQIRFRAVGATTNSEAVSTSATWFDGRPHVAIGALTQAASGLNLYRDDIETAQATATGVVGSISNAIGFTAGASNDGASALMACAPLIAYGYYGRLLTATERVSLARYLMNYPGYRPPPSPTLLVDMRDDRTWNGTGTQLVDIGGPRFDGTVVGTPTTRAVPWALHEAERF